MSRPKLKIPIFFSKRPPNSFLHRSYNKLATHNGSVIRDIVRMLLDLYVSKCKVEEVQLDNVLVTYSIESLVNVQIGLVGEELYYVVQEPEVTETDLDNIVDKVTNEIIDGRKNDPRACMGYGQHNLDKATYNYIKVTSGWGPLTPCVLDSYVEDIFLSKNINRVHVLHTKFSWIGWLKTNIVVYPELVDRLVLSLARRMGKHISLVNPLAEGSYGDNYRVSLIYGNTVSPHGSSIVVRKRGSIVWTITKLIDSNVLTSLEASYLWLTLENRGWIVIAGHVGSGKTTLLQALLSLIPPYKKVITIEDTPEITGTTGLWEPLIEKSEVFTRASQIDSFTLLKFALRRRPDYIVIGEVRGIEARLLVHASRLGHGVLNTIHADSPESVLKRLIAPPISIPRSLLNNIWAIVVMGTQGNRRKVLSLTEIDNDTSLIEICPGTTGHCDVQNILESTTRLSRIYPKDVLHSEIVKRATFLEGLVSRGVFSADELSTKVIEFYNNVGVTN